MNRRFFRTALFCLAAFSPVRADQAIESIQQKLKDHGFYHGEINGKKDANTTAAIRRYQIRNGLQITGEINAETQRSLGITYTAPSTPRPRPSATPIPDKPTLRQEPTEPKPVPAPRQPADPHDPGDESVYVPGPHGLRPETSGIFGGTPFEVAPPDVQRRVIIGAQTLLARRGYYRNAIDGVYGPGMDFAVRTYQARMDLPPTGRLDMETLASLGLPPGQRTPGFGPPRRQMFQPRSRIGPTGERIYIPN
jgi:peptidoglycan hydrolase-like protein with peptidoglycan-binding domain